MNPNPVENPELFDVITLGGKTSPGVVTLSGHDRKINWDVKEGSGQSGASTTLKSIPPIEFTASFFLSDVEDFDAWDTFVKTVWQTFNGPKPVALDIYHPDLAANNIKSVCGALVGGCVHDGMGGKTYSIKFQEYAPPKPAGGSPRSKATPDPDADLKREIAALTATNERTPWG